jgi:hypothetical protein
VQRQRSIRLRRMIHTGAAHIGAIAATVLSAIGTSGSLQTTRAFTVPN